MNLMCAFAWSKSNPKFPSWSKKKKDLHQSTKSSQILFPSKITTKVTKQIQLTFPPQLSIQSVCHITCARKSTPDRGIGENKISLILPKIPLSKGF